MDDFWVGVMVTVGVIVWFTGVRFSFSWAVRDAESVQELSGPGKAQFWRKIQGVFIFIFYCGFWFIYWPMVVAVLLFQSRFYRNEER